VEIYHTIKITAAKDLKEELLKIFDPEKSIVSLVMAIQRQRTIITAYVKLPAMLP